MKRMAILKYRRSLNKQKGENRLTLTGYEAHIVYGKKVTVIEANDVTLGRNGQRSPNH